MRTVLATLVAMAIAGACTSADAQVVTRGERLARPMPEGRALLRSLAGPTNLRTSGSPAYAWLGWDAVAGATGYLVTRTDATGAATTLTPTAITDPVYSDYSGLTPGQTYTYRVSAVRTTLDGRTLSDGWAGAGSSAMGNNLHGVSISNSAPPGIYIFRVDAYYHPNVRTPAEIAPRDTVTKP